MRRVLFASLLLVGAGLVAACTQDAGELPEPSGLPALDPGALSERIPQPDEWLSIPPLPEAGPVGNLHEEGVWEDELPKWSEEEIAAYVRANRHRPTLADKAPAGAPNIVVVIADDMPRGILGFEGNSIIKTPNLDKLRANGVYFTNFYLPLGQCAPSRSVLWTSLYPTESGVETNGHLFKDASTMVLPLWLRQHGYRTGFFGKCHIGTSNPGSLDVDWHFDSIFHMEGDSAVDPAKFDMYNAKVHLLKNAAPAVPGVHLTRMITDRAMEFALQPSADPFFIWVAHRAPHPSTLADTGPNQQWSNSPPGSPHYSANQMPVALHPAKAGDSLAGKPPQQKNSPSRYGYNLFSAEPGGVSEHMRRAFEQVHYMDQQVGALMDGLAAAGKLENTVFVFLSDNGAFFGERKLCLKGPFLYDEMVRVPLVISWPAKLPKGVTNDALIQSTDLGQTLLEGAGLPAMPDNSGRSFWEVALGGERVHRRSVFFQYHSQKDVISKVRGVLKDGYKLSHHLATWYFSQPNDNAAAVPLVLFSPFTWELYDLQSDPNELTSLLPYVEKGPSALQPKLADPAWRPRLNDLLRTLAEYQTEALDDEGLSLASVSVTRTSQGSATVSWQSLKASAQAPVNATTEVVYRKQGCPLCTVYEVDHKSYVSDHSVTLDGLEAGAAYEALLFSLTASTNGGVARVVVPASPGQSAGAVAEEAVSLSYRAEGYKTQVAASSGPDPMPEAQCHITGGAGALLLDAVNEYSACIDECRQLLQTNPNSKCMWDGNVFQMPPSSLCKVIGGAGTLLFEAPTSWEDCLSQCAQLTQTNPNAACNWHGEVFQDHAGGTCLVEGGAGAQLYLAGDTSFDFCKLQCALLTVDHPNAACFWAEVVIQPHPTATCFIEGGCDAPLFTQTLTNFECVQQCDAFQVSNPSCACYWNSQIFHDHPTSTCTITGGAGKLLFEGSATKCTCVNNCTSWTQSNPNCHCVWGAETIK